MSGEGGKPVVMVFARQPVAGQVKTRLIPALGAQGACKLHVAMLRRVLSAVSSLPDVEGQLWLDGDGAGLDAEWYRGFSLHRQGGKDLGERMARGFEENFATGYGPVLVCGADCPALTSHRFQQMLDGLQTHDAVVVPALDGGYVALGIQRFDPVLLQDIPWGGATVYDETVRALERLRWRWQALPALPDIDRPADLHYLQDDPLAALLP